MGLLNKFDISGIKRTFNLQNYMETGTGTGESLSFVMSFNFNKYLTVDIDEDLSTSTSKKYPNARYYVGKSTDVLGDMLEDLGPEPALIFLDAHFPGADFHKISYLESMETYKEDAFPLEKELTLLKELRNIDNDVIIIDDYWIYDKTEDFHKYPFLVSNDWFESLDGKRVWKHQEFVDNLEMNINLNIESFLESIANTHDVGKVYQDQGYLIITPKEKE